MKKISCGGEPFKPGRLQRKWVRFWARRSGTDLFGRFASRLAAKFFPPHAGQVRLAYYGPNGYIDAFAQIHHADFQVGNNVYIAPRVIIFQAAEGGAITFGDKVSIHRDVVFETGQSAYIKIGAKSSIHPGSQLKAYAQPIIIGEGVMIAANSALYSYDHGMIAGVPMREQPIASKAPIRIGDEAWIGTGAIILSGVTIGKGAVVGAGSVVIKDIPDNAIAVGNPARVVKMREKQNEVNTEDDK